MTVLKDAKINLGDVIKAAIAAVPVLITLGTAIWAFSAWTERVNLRLDDIDKDLKSIHEHYKIDKPLASENAERRSTWHVRRISNP
jgi:spermidine synthase